ncbi:chromosome segregation protein Csm1/Pcs1-domain-containing protein [Elsinoe ampelina]|uniref:Chromosome segregation protein Csm1/Pcs1-domain-containing protein n=1 Tax=Elsinoe ampelina TaxID=302913 RepID=A0A6A6GDL7_9PEZI|nr:chromosome segregation protein Csm1/Pcs1-domain-containing protein [Elsinoe ampelina]
MPARTRVSTGETSLADFETDPSIMAETKFPKINRAVAKAPKKQTSTAKKASTTTKKAAARQPLKDRTNMKDTSDAEEEEEIVPTKPKSRKASARAIDDDVEPKAKKARTKAAAKDEPKKAAKARANTKRAMSPDHMHTIPETQPLQDVSESIENDTETMEVEETDSRQESERVVARARSASQQRQAPSYAVPARARSTSQQPRAYSREGSAALAERRLAESEARRKLADMTSKYEDMRLRYESLSELGSKAADSNFDKLKRATDQRAKDASDLISSLKKELSEARKSTSTNNAENAKLTTQLNTLQSSHEQAESKMKEMKTSLAESHNEIKSLTAKLEAAREAARKAASEAAKMPGSAIKSRDHSTRNNLNTGNLDSAKEAALKEEIYRDLTGLIINSVKRKDGEDEYSCIQTGRNGTLHFHLCVNNDSTQMNPKTPSGLSYEDAEFAYEPFLDDDRDRDLIDILPEYLTEEICFPRGHAVRFYSKIVDSMTKKVVIEDE